MATACRFGASALNTTTPIYSTSFRPKLTSSPPLRGLLRTTKLVQFHAFFLSTTSTNALIRCRNSADSAISDDKDEETNSSEVVTKPFPNSVEVETLLTVLCDTTSIAEFELKRSGFRLYVKRNLVEQYAPPPPAKAPLPTPVVPQTVDTPSSNGSALVPARPMTFSSGIQRFLDKAADEGLVILHSPKVGVYKSYRTIKGKRTPPLCKENDIVKEGKAICIIEQLGAQIPVQSEISGEVVKIFKKDDDSVGYGDPLVAILPSFPGIKSRQ